MSRGPVSAPESGFSAYLPDDAAGIQGGFTVPVGRGAYLGVGAAQRRLDNVLSDGAAAWQTVAGARVSVPLLKDRGFASQQAREEYADAKADELAWSADAALSAVARDAAVAFAYELYAGALFDQYLKALSRVTTLQIETAERVRLETMAEYQVFPAEMEVQFKLDDVRQAAATYTNAHNALEQAAGGVCLPYRRASLLVEWAAACVTTDVTRIVADFGAMRPEVRAARMAVAASEARERELEVSLRSDLVLSAGVGYQGENTGAGFGNDTLLRDEKAGVDAALVWCRPFSFDAEEAAVRAQRRRTAALREELRRAEIAAETQRRQAEALFASATERFETVGKAVAFAAKALESEEERLGLGEGRSRNVLDAQSDLTSAEGRANLAAYDVVCSFLDLMLAGGVDFVPKSDVADDGEVRCIRKDGAD